MGSSYVIVLPMCACKVLRNGFFYLSTLQFLFDFDSNFLTEDEGTQQAIRLAELCGSTEVK